MPYNKKLEVPAENIRTGDRLRFTGREYTVESVDTKVKYVYLRFEEDTEPYQLDRAKTVKVWRQQATPAEDYERNSSRFIDTVLVTMNRVILEDWPGNQKRFKSNIGSRSMVDAWDIDKFIKGQAQWYCWARLNHGLRSRAGKPIDTEITEKQTFEADFTWWDYLEQHEILSVIREWTEELFEDVWRGVSTWSSGGTANAMRYIEMEVKRDIVDRHKRYLERLDELEKLAEGWVRPEE